MKCREHFKGEPNPRGFVFHPDIKWKLEKRLFQIKLNVPQKQITEQLFIWVEKMNLSDVDLFIYTPKVSKSTLNELWAYNITFKVENNASFVLCEQSHHNKKKRSKVKLVQNIMLNIKISVNLGFF